jgi:hypothetical protein
MREAPLVWKNHFFGKYAGEIQVSNYGQIAVRDWVVNPEIDAAGYYTFKGKKVHLLVWEAFNGSKPTGCAVHHLDGDKTNNSLYNLACINKSLHTAVHNSSVIEPLYTPQRKEKRIKKITTPRKTIDKWQIIRRSPLKWEVYSSHNRKLDADIALEVFRDGNPRCAAMIIKKRTKKGYGHENV